MTKISMRLFGLALFLPAVGITGDLSVHTDFPGGSAAVELIDQEKRSIRFMPTDHANRGWRCWWYFRLEGIEVGETLTLDLGDAPWATPDQAAWSDDDGRTWQQTEPGVRNDKRIVYRFPAKKSGSHWFAWGPPFVLKDAQRLIEATAKAGDDWAKPFTLTTSLEGHEVPSIRISQSGDPKFGIWIQARQHAWESGSSWVCRGFLEWLVSPEATELRKVAEIVVTPIMDIDNVQRGAGGKNQNPWDHNRDWREAPHWPEVVAAQKGIREMHEAGRFHLFVDLHNPGANDREAFYFTPPRDGMSEAALKNLTAFVGFTKASITGPILFKGKVIESGPQYDPKNWRYISKNWVSNNTSKSAVAVTLETGWNTPGSHTEGYKAVGRQLGEAIQGYVGELAGAE